jgi:hypothetical protein
MFSTLRTRNDLHTNPFLVIIIIIIIIIIIMCNKIISNPTL